MRIIAGKYKGRVLNEFDLPNTRPTSDMVRESLFNILYSVEDNSFLDLFAGTGAVGFEALSRGAKSVVFVEHNINSYKTIIKNARYLTVENVKIIKSDFKAALISFDKQKLFFDVIFLDPPYKSNLAEEALAFLKNSSIVDSSSMIVWEHDKEKCQIEIDGFNVVNLKRYGDKYLRFMQRSK